MILLFYVWILCVCWYGHNGLVSANNTPTPSPTQANFALVYFNGYQIINNISSSEFSSVTSQASFVETLNYLTLYNASSTVFQFHPILSNNGPSVEVVYNLTFTCPSASSTTITAEMNRLINQIKTSVNKKVFQTTLRSFGNANGNAYIMRTTVTIEPTFGPYVIISSHVSNTGSASSIPAGVLAAIILGSFFGIAAFFGGLYYYTRSEIIRTAKEVDAYVASCGETELVTNPIERKIDSSADVGDSEKESQIFSV